MKEYLKQKWYWLDHLVWIVGTMFKYLLKGDVRNFNEAYFWTKIHLTYKSKRIK